MTDALGKLRGVIEKLDVKKKRGEGPKVTKLVYKKKPKVKTAIYTRTSAKTNEKKAGRAHTLHTHCNPPATLHAQRGEAPPCTNSCFNKNVCTSSGRICNDCA